DTAAAHRIAGRLKYPERATIVPRQYFSPREMMSMVACCRLLVTMRYHFCVFGALQRVPFIAIARADKIADLSLDMGWQAVVVPPDVEAGDIVEHAERFRHDPGSVGVELYRAVERLRRRALDNRGALDCLKDGSAWSKGRALLHAIAGV